MNPQNHDDLTNELGRTLQHQADGISGSPITLGDVKGTATRIRRRRAISASAAVAAGIAIIVPTAMFGGGLFPESADKEVPPASEGPTSNDITLGVPLELTDLPTGDAPRIAWITGKTLHTADGGTLTLNRAYSDAVRFDNGFLATYTDDGVQIGVLLDANGQPTGERFETSYELAVSSDGDQVLYVADGALLLHDNASGDTESIRMDAGPETRPIAVMDDTAYYNVQLEDYSSDARWYRTGEEHDPRPKGTFSYTSVTDDGWATAIVKVTDTGTCSVSVAPDGTEAGRTCDVLLDDFSPDGQHILASPSYGDGYAAGQLAVTTREPSDTDESTLLLDFLQTGEADAGFMEARWEDDEHVLAVMPLPIQGTSDKMWHLVRIGLDGSVENTVEPVRAGEFANPFQLTSG